MVVPASHHGRLRLARGSHSAYSRERLRREGRQSMERRPRAGVLAPPGVLWHLSNLACRNPPRTSCKPVAGGNRHLRVSPRRANAWRDWWRRAVPTNGPAVAAQSSTPGAVQSPPHLVYPALRASCPADDIVRLQKTSRLLFLLFELPRLTNRGQPRAGRGSRGQRRHGQDTACGGSEQSCSRSPQ